MSHWQNALVAGTAGLLVTAASCCFGQTGVTSVTPALRNTDRDGRIVVSDKQAIDLGLNAPLTTDRQNLPLPIKDRLQRFEGPREAYQREQEQLRKRLTGAATEAERERIRALIKERHEDWRRRARDLRAQSKDRIAELRRQMPSKSEILDAARENAREATSEIRRRRGQD